MIRLSKRSANYAEIRDIRGASVLLSRSIIQYLIPGAHLRLYIITLLYFLVYDFNVTEKGIKLTPDNEKMGGVAHSKCNKDIRIGVTASCKEYGMKITGRGSIAGCESSNLIDIPIICDVLQSVGLFEDSSFPNPSDKADKAERAWRKAAKKAAALKNAGDNLRDQVLKGTPDESAIASATKGDSATESSMKTPTETSSGPAMTMCSKQLGSSAVPHKAIRSSSPVIPILLDPPHISERGKASKGNANASNMRESPADVTKSVTVDQKYSPNVIDIEAVLTARWEHLLRDYLQDMRKKKTPLHYHAADGISSDGVAVVSSNMVNNLPSSRTTPKAFARTPKINMNGGRMTGEEDMSPTKCKDAIKIDTSPAKSGSVVHVGGGGGNSASPQSRSLGVTVVKSDNRTPESSPTPVLIRNKKNNAIVAAKTATKLVMPLEMTSPRQTPITNSISTRLSTGRGDGSGDCVVQASTELDDETKSSLDKLDTKELKYKDIPKDEKRATLKINTDHEFCENAAATSRITTSNDKMCKRKELQDMASPAAGSSVGGAPTLPPRIGSGGVGGTTTGYSIAQNLLKPSFMNLDSCNGRHGKVLKNCGPPMTAAQHTFCDPKSSLQAWSKACYEEGIALEEEEKLLRYISGKCELSIPSTAYRIGTHYLHHEYEYLDEIARLKKMADDLDRKEDEEYGVREKAIRDHRLDKNRGEGSSKRRKIGMSGSGKNKVDKNLLENDTLRHRGVESQMIHSAVTLDNPDGTSFDQFEGEDCEKVTDHNVCLTSKMLWLRAKANAVYKPSAIPELKQRIKREKMDYFESYLSDWGGEAIATVATTTLAAVGGMKQLRLHDDEKLSNVVLGQVEKIKKGSKNSASKVTSLHPGAVEALDLHGVSSVSMLPIGQPGGGVKRQRSLSNIQQSLSSSVDTKSIYYADTIGGYPTKNTIPQLIIHPPLYSNLTTPHEAKKAKIDHSSSDCAGEVIHYCPTTGRVSLPDLAIFSVRMPWKLLAREFEVFDPAAMERDALSFPRTPTSLPPTSPRFPVSFSSSSSALVAQDSAETTSNLNGPMGIWVSTSESEHNRDEPGSGLRIAAFQSAASSVRRRRKRNSDGVLMELDDEGNNSSPRSSQAGVLKSDQANETREFRRIAFSDVLAPSFRRIESKRNENSAIEKGSDEDDEDISDEAMLHRHEATLANMRDRWKAIQDLKQSLKRTSSSGDLDKEHGIATSSGNTHIIIHCTKDARAVPDHRHRRTISKK